MVADPLGFSHRLFHSTYAGGSFEISGPVNSESTLAENSPPRGFRRTVASAFGATGAVFIADRLLDVCFLAVLARLLAPTDFGVSAATVVVVMFLIQFAQLGLMPTLVQMPNLSERIVAVARTLALGMSIVATILAEVFTHAISSWFNHSDVTKALPWACLACIAYGLSVVPHALMARRMQARDLCVIEMICGIIGTGMVAIPLALTGFGYWALIIGALVAAVIKAVVLLVRVKMPGFAFEVKLAKRLVTKGAGFSLTVLSQKVATESDRIVVGRYMTPLHLGLYARASGLMGIPAILYGGVVDRVVFPAFSRVQSEADRLRAAYTLGLSLTASVGLPLCVFLFFTGPDVIRLILGPAWDGAIDPFKILCLATYFRLSDRISAMVLRGLGKPYLLSIAQAVLGASLIVLCLIAVGYGLIGVAIAVVCNAAISYLLLTVMAGKIAGVRVTGFIAAHGPGVAMALLTAAILWPVMTLAGFWHASAFLTLVLAGGAASLVALAGAVVAPSIFLGQAGRIAVAASLDLIRSRRAGAVA